MGMEDEILYNLGTGVHYRPEDLPEAPTGAFDPNAVMALGIKADYYNPKSKRVLPERPDWLFDWRVTKTPKDIETQRKRVTGWNTYWDNIRKIATSPGHPQAKMAASLITALDAMDRTKTSEWIRELQRKGKNFGAPDWWINRKTGKYVVGENKRDDDAAFAAFMSRLT